MMSLSSSFAPGGGVAAQGAVFDESFDVAEDGGGQGLLRSSLSSTGVPIDGDRGLTNGEMGLPLLSSHVSVGVPTAVSFRDPLSTSKAVDLKAG